MREEWESVEEQLRRLLPSEDHREIWIVDAGLVIGFAVGLVFSAHEQSPFLGFLLGAFGTALIGSFVLAMVSEGND